MSATIIVTGSALAAPAMELARQRGARLITLDPYTPPDQIAATVAREGADAIIVRAAHITETVITASPSLKVIVKHGIGVDTIDVDCATRHRIPVLITLGANAQSVAEHALGLMFALARATPRLDLRMRQGYWDKATSFGCELAGKSLGLVGLGNIARALARLVRPLDMAVRGYDPFVTEPIPAIESVRDLEELLAGCDIISLHCPLTPETRHILNGQRLRTMRPRALLINTARGGLIDHQALAEVLAAGHLTGVALDCFPEEPPPENNPLWAFPNLIVTPHIGANTHEAAERVGVRAVTQALDTVAGKPFDPQAVINPGHAKPSRIFR